METTSDATSPAAPQACGDDRQSAARADELSGTLDCCSDPSGACLLNEALESKRNDRSGLLRAIRREFPEAADRMESLGSPRTQPVVGCGRSDADCNPLPISFALLRSRAALGSERESPLSF